MTGLAETLATIVVFAPLLGAIICGLFNRFIGEKVAMFVATALLFVAAACAGTIFIGHWQHSVHLPAEPIRIATWIHVGDLKSTWSIRLDAISAVMMIVVTGVSSLVHLYSWGYMAEDPHKPRFFAYLSLFTFAMLSLVTAADFMQLFFGWEGVGLASYLLIGFWYHKRSANDAQIKAFVVNRVGDFGFALGIMAVFFVFGTIEFKEVFAMVPEKAGVMLKWGVYQLPAIEIIAFLLFIGAMGKSAQFFLHTWLPDAMEGPTPVSALIHAATMVTAGVVLVCLCSPIYEAAPGTAGFITIIGAVTALFAATVGLAQNDIKRVIAYSTCSQLGFMFFAAGIGAYQAAMFHLFTHAFFKALLFLGAGSVIHGMHHEQDMRHMGGIWKKMPITYAFMWIGSLALAGVPFFAGFYSKDLIIETAFDSGGFQGPLLGTLTLIGAAITAFYMTRVMILTFTSKARWDEDAHPHESPILMWLPMVVLAIGSVSTGYLFTRGDSLENWLSPVFGEHGGHSKEHLIPPLVVSALALFSVSIGVSIAIIKYQRNEIDRVAPANVSIFTRLARRDFGQDAINETLFMRPGQVITDVLVKSDDKVIDGAVRGIGRMAIGSGAVLRKSQSGFARSYAAFILIGAILMIAGIWVVTQ
jgi:NADH-quinone oxidoreductase subunit L